MIEPTDKQVKAACEAWPQGDHYYETLSELLRKALRAALNVEPPVTIDGTGWAEAAFEDVRKVKWGEYRVVPDLIRASGINRW